MKGLISLGLRCKIKSHIFIGIIIDCEVITALKSGFWFQGIWVGFDCPFLLESAQTISIKAS